MFENPLFIIPFLTGIIFTLSGFIMLRFPPKKINSLYGYRTQSSMKSIERWNFAQEYSSKEIIKLVIILTVCCLFGFISPFSNFTNMIIGLSLMIVMVIVLLWKVEKAIKNKFEKESEEKRPHNSCQTPSLKFGFGKRFFTIFVFS